MPLYSQDNDASLAAGLQAAETSYRQLFADLYVNKQPGFWQTYAEKITGNSEYVQFNFASNFPQMREWKGDRIEKWVRSHTMTAKLKTFENTMTLRRKTVEYLDKNLGIVSSTIRNFMATGAQAYDQECIRELTAASDLGNTCFDGVALISASHPYGSAGATWSNLASGTNYSWTAQDAGRQAMREFTLENGEPAGMNATHLLVGPKLERKAKDANEAKDRIVLLGPTGVETTSSAPGVNTATPFTNVWAGELNVIVDSRITDYTWRLMDLSKPGVRPIYLYEAKAPSPQIMDQMDNPDVFNRDVFTYGLYGDYVALPGHPLSIYCGTGTA